MDVEIDNEIVSAIKGVLEQYIPVKEDAYVAWSDTSKDFYVCTTDEESLHGRITMKEITDLFIDHFQQGEGGAIDAEIADPFIAELELSIKRIKGKVI